MDKRLRDLIRQACDADSSDRERKRSLHRLLILVQRLPNLIRSSHPDYAIALNQTLDWFCRNLESFEERPPSLQRSLEVWVNGYLKWRIRDLYIDDQAHQKRQTSLDRPIGDSDATRLDRLASPTPSLSNLTTYIEAIQDQQRQQLGRQIQALIEQDPDGVLSRCHPRSAPDCNCQMLTIRLLLREPPERISTLAREFQVKDQTLYSHWKKKCLPCLFDIAQRFSPS
ncbi:MAG: hypothetical protein ACFB5Z_20875 [Elainellaceae cyanobacterium]